MPTTDLFGTSLPGLSSPADHAAAITKHDTNVLTYATRALYIGGDGNVKVTTLGGEDVTFVGLVAGTVLPIRVTKVFSTDTTATNIVGIW